MGIIALFLGSIIGFVFSKVLYTKPLQKFQKVGRHKGYHFHHSLYGILIFFIIPFLSLASFMFLILIGFGLGNVLHHTKREGLIFITKEG